jgi:hypothetical protein
MIDSFDILVPSTVRVGETFEIRVRALDASGQVVTTDNTTVVQISSTDLSLLYDANEDLNFELGDNQKTLVNGEAVFSVLDAKAGTFTITADDFPQGSVTIEGSVDILYGFNAIPIYQLEYSPEVAFEGFPGFFQARDTVGRDDPVAIVEYEAGATNELRDPLPVTLVP